MTEHSVDFFHTKSKDYRVVHADGAWGGLTGNLSVHMAFYAEFREPPAKLTITEHQGKRSERRTGPERIVRELQVEVMISVDTARALRTWLDDKIKLAESTIEELSPPASATDAEIDEEDEP